MRVFFSRLHSIIKTGTNTRACRRVFCGIPVDYIIAVFENVYLGSITTEIVKPAERHRVNTLAETLHQGYTIYSPHNPTSNGKEFFERLSWALVSEGFRDELIKRSQNSSVKPLPSNYVATSSLSPDKILNTIRKALIPFVQHSLSTFILQPFINSLKYECDWIQKSYNREATWFQVHTALLVSVSTKLERILFDSGLRLLWANRGGDKGNSNNKRMERTIHVDKISTIKSTDLRFRAILSTWGLGLLLALVRVSVEISWFRLRKFCLLKYMLGLLRRIVKMTICLRERLRTGRKLLCYINPFVWCQIYLHRNYRYKTPKQNNYK